MSMTAYTVRDGIPRVGATWPPSPDVRRRGYWLIRTVPIRQGFRVEPADTNVWSFAPEETPDP